MSVIKPEPAVAQGGSSSHNRRQKRRRSTRLAPPTCIVRALKQARKKLAAGCEKAEPVLEIEASALLSPPGPVTRKGR